MGTPLETLHGVIEDWNRPLISGFIKPDKEGGKRAVLEPRAWIDGSVVDEDGQISLKDDPVIKNGTPVTYQEIYGRAIDVKLKK